MEAGRPLAGADIRDLLVAARKELSHPDRTGCAGCEEFADAILATPSGIALLAKVAALESALRDMISLATHGAARDHLDQAGILQDPPHGWGKYGDCEAPWCVRHQARIAAARAALAVPSTEGGTE